MPPEGYNKSFNINDWLDNLRQHYKTHLTHSQEDELELTGSFLVEREENHKKNLYLQAIKESKLELYIENETYFAGYFNLVPNCFGLYSKIKDISKFWDKVKELESLGRN